MEDVFHKIYTNSDINIQNIKLISSPPPFFYIENTTCSGVVTSGYDMYLDHILVWNIVCWFVTTSDQKEKRNVHYFIILTYFLMHMKRIPGNGVESEDHSTKERCTLFHGLCPCTLMEKSLRKGCLKGLVVAKIVISSFFIFVHLTRSACACTG